MTSHPLARRWRDNLDHSVSALHRTRGSFGAETTGRAIDFPGPATRLTAAAVALVCAGLVGAAFMVR